MPDFNLGGVGVHVGPDFTGFRREAQAELDVIERELGPVEVRLVSDLTAGFRREAEAKAKEALTDAKVSINVASDLVAGFRKEAVAKAREAMADAKVKIDMEPNDRGFKGELRRQVKEASAGINAEVGLDPKMKGGKQKFRAETNRLIKEAAVGLEVKVGFAFPHARTVRIKMNEVLREAGEGLDVKVKFDLPAARTAKIKLNEVLKQAGEGLSVKVGIEPQNWRTIKIELRKVLKQASEGLEIQIPVRIVGAREARTQARLLAADISKTTAIPLINEGSARRGTSLLKGLHTAMGKVWSMAKMTAIGVGLFGVAVAAVGAAGIKSATDLEQQRLSLRLLTGDAKLATEEFNAFLKVANTTPFEIPEVLATAKQLKVIGMEGPKAVETLRTLADVTALTGGTGKNMENVAIALAKISGQGKTTQRELRMLFTNLPGFSPIKAIAKELGVSVPEAFRKITASQVSSKVAIDAVLKGMKDMPGAAGAAAKITQETFKGAFTNIPDLARTAFYKSFATALPALTAIIAPGGPLVQIMDEYLPTIAHAFVPLITNIADVILSAGPLINEMVLGVMPLFESLAGLAKTLLPGIQKGVAFIAKPLADLVQTLVTMLGGLGDLVGPLGSVLGEAMQKVADALAAADMSGIRRGLEDAIGAAGQLVATLAPLLPFVIEVANTVATMFDGAIKGAEGLMVVLAPLTRLLGGSKAAADAVGIVLGTVILVRMAQWVAGLRNVIRTTVMAETATGVLGQATAAIQVIWLGVRQAIGEVTIGASGATIAITGTAEASATLATSLGMAAAALAPFALIAGAAGGLYLLSKYMHNASDDAKEFTKNIKGKVAGDNLKSIDSAIARVTKRQEVMMKNWNDASGLEKTGRAFKALGQFLSPAEDTVNRTKEETKALDAELVKLQNQRLKYTETATAVMVRLSKETHRTAKLGITEVAALMDQWNIDPNKLGITKATNEVMKKIREFAQMAGADTGAKVRTMFESGADGAERIALAMDKTQKKLTEFTDPITAFMGKTDVTQGQITKWFQTTDAQLTEWSGNIRKAIQAGYDPQLISDVLQQGPAQASSFLNALVSHDAEGYRKQFEGMTAALSDQSQLAIEMSRITNLAIGKNTQEAAGLATTAMRIAQAEFVSGTTQTAEDLAKALKIGLPTVKQAVEEYGLTIAETVDPLLEALGQRKVFRKVFMQRKRAAAGGFAEGGYVPGPPVRQDVVPAMLMPGEVVIRRDSVDKFGAEALLRLNRGEIPKGWHVPRFAEGGQVTAPGVRRGQEYAQRQVGKPHVWGATGPDSFDCSGLWSAIVSVVQGQAPRRLFTSATLVDNAKKIGMLPGLGVVSVGARKGNPGHVAGTIGGLNYEATPPRVLGPGKAKGAASFPNVFHIGSGLWVGDNGVVVPVPKPVMGLGAYGNAANASNLTMYAAAKEWVAANTFASPTSLGSLMEQGAPTGARGGPNQALAEAQIRAAMLLTGVPAYWFEGLTTIARRESNYDPLAINNWDSNAKKGTPSKGLFQTIDPTFRAYALPGHNNIFNGLDNAIAAIRYIMARYGDIWNVQQAHSDMPPRGYENGGLSLNEQLAWISERNKPELILPLTKPDRVRDLADRHGLTDFLIAERERRQGARRDGPAMVLNMTPPAAQEPETYAAAMENRLAPLLADV